MERNEILSVAIDAVRGVNGNFSAKQTSDDLRNAFVELNGGSDKLNVKKFHRGNELFELVEELIPVIIDEGIKSSDNPLIQALVDYRNIADGDSAEFETEGKANFVVASAAAGIAGVRRQRIAGGEMVKVDPEMQVVRVYENLGRLLAGKIDFNKFVDGVSKAFEAHIAQKAIDTLMGVTSSTAGLNSTYVKTGSCSVDSLVELAAHVEAATGATVRFIGTKACLRKFGSAMTYSNEQNKDLYDNGFIGRLGGYECIGMKQAHKPGTDTFALPDDALIMVAGTDKPIKVVNAGEGYLVEKEAGVNADLTQEYIYMQGLGVGAIFAEKIGYWSSITVA